jgi:hypothetical protein
LWGIPKVSGHPVLVFPRRRHYDPGMLTREFFIVFPEGDIQEIPGRLSVNELVDINGRSLDLPLPTNKMIVFRVARITVHENRGSHETFHFLELMSAEELIPYAQCR